MNDTRDMLVHSVHGFVKAAVLVEKDIHRKEISRSDREILSLKSVCHFNLGIALELMLKKLILNSGGNKRNTHLLVELHDDLSKDFQAYLEKLFRETLSASGSIELEAFCISSTKPEGAPENRKLDDLYDFLLYFDEDVILWEKRYSWEHFSEQRWNYYLRDLSLFVHFIERVMKSMEPPS